MGIAADRLDDVRVEASSPDGQIAGILRPPAELSIAFSYNRYHRYTEADLERQLSRLVYQLWTDYRAARPSAVAEATGRPAIEDKAQDPDSRRYRAERDKATYEGMSKARNVFVRSTGLRKWRFVLREGTLAAMGEAAFTADVASAYYVLMRDFRQKQYRLRDKHFLD